MRRGSSLQSSTSFQGFGSENWSGRVIVCVSWCVRRELNPHGRDGFVCVGPLVRASGFEPSFVVVFGIVCVWVGWCGRRDLNP